MRVKGSGYVVNPIPGPRLTPWDSSFGRNPPLGLLSSACDDTQRPEIVGAERARVGGGVAPPLRLSSGQAGLCSSSLTQRYALGQILAPLRGWRQAPFRGAILRS